MGRILLGEDLEVWVEAGTHETVEIGLFESRKLTVTADEALALASALREVAWQVKPYTLPPARPGSVKRPTEAELLGEMVDEVEARRLARLSAARAA